MGESEEVLLELAAAGCLRTRFFPFSEVDCEISGEAEDFLGGPDLCSIVGVVPV